MHSAVKSHLFTAEAPCRWSGFKTSNEFAPGARWGTTGAAEARKVYLVKIFTVCTSKGEVTWKTVEGQTKKQKTESKKGKPVVLGPDLIDQIPICIFPDITMTVVEGILHQLYKGNLGVAICERPQTVAHVG